MNRLKWLMAMSGSQWWSGGLESRPPVGHIGPSAAFRHLPDKRSPMGIDHGTVPGDAPCI